MSQDESGPHRTRRRFLATGASATLGVFAGCFSYGGGGSDSGGEEELSTDADSTIVAQEHGVNASVRRVEHTPGDNEAIVEGAISVPREMEYEIRLGVIDQDGVVLAQKVRETLLYTTGTNLESAELQVEDCESCHSGLVDVRLSQSALQELEQEQEEQREQEQQQRQERMNEQQEQSQNESTDAAAGGTPVAPAENESERGGGDA